jgi:hypothetical protein
MSLEIDFGSEAGAVYGDALDALDQAGLRYMLGGALALNAYTGIWRDTKDLDLFVPEGAVTRVLETLEEAGFETETTDPVWLAKACRGEIFLDIIHSSHNGTGPVEESWFENAKEVQVLGRTALAIPAEEMILSKIFVVAKDRCDVDDVLHLIFATHGDLDWDRMLSRIGEHWELLLAYLHFYRYVYPTHPHYLPRRVMELLNERYQREDRASSEDALRFRGTMLDEDSFAVDVEEWGLPDEREAIREARSSGEERG